MSAVGTNRSGNFHNLARSIKTVRSFAETEAKSTEIGQLLLKNNGIDMNRRKINTCCTSGSAVEKIEKDKLSTACRTNCFVHRRMRKMDFLNKATIFRSKSAIEHPANAIHDSSFESEASSLTDSTTVSLQNSCSSSTSDGTIEKTSSFSTVSSSSETSKNKNVDTTIIQQRPKKRILKIRTQEESSYGPKKKHGDEDSESMQSAISPKTYTMLLENLISVYFYDNNKSKGTNRRPSFKTATHGTAEDENENEERIEKSVRFSTVKVHYHTQILGNQTTVKKGPPLSLGKWMASSVMKVDSFEKSRRCLASSRKPIIKQSRQQQQSTKKLAAPVGLLIPPNERLAILLRAGVSKREIVRCEKEIQAARKELRKTNMMNDGNEWDID